MAHILKNFKKKIKTELQEEMSLASKGIEGLQNFHLCSMALHRHQFSKGLFRFVLSRPPFVCLELWGSQYKLSFSRPVES